MDVATVNHWLLKDVLIDFGPSGEPAPQGRFVEARIELVQPPLQPAFFLLVDTIVPTEPCLDACGVQLVPNEPDRFFFANIPPWDFEFARGRRRRTLFRIQLPDDVVPPVQVVFADVRGEYHPVAWLHRNRRNWELLRSPDWPAAPIRATGGGPGRLPYFFVGGTPKSGTTWVEKILNAHPSVFCTGEGGFFVDLPTDAFVYWLKEDMRDFNSWSLPKREIALAAQQTNAALALYAFRTHADAWPGVETIGDRTPSNSLCCQTIGGAIPESKFIHCVRHPLDVVVSRLYHEWNQILEQREFVSVLTPRRREILRRHLVNGEPSFPMTVDDAPLVNHFLAEWVRINRRATEFARLSPDRFHVIRYEDMLVDFRGMVDALFRFILGRIPSRDEWNVIEALSSFEFLSGGRSRGSADNRAFFRKGVAGDHQGRFDKALLAWVAEKIGPIAGPMGYDLNALC